MPPRAPINPEGCYHVGARGCYGRTLFDTDDQHELFLTMYARAARKHSWKTLAWALVKNNHHFIIELSTGGLSEGMRELHGGYSRWIHEYYGQTRQGHLFRHGFFARELETEGAVLVACAYVDLNSVPKGSHRPPETPSWSGYRATLGLDEPRPFHHPEELLALVAHRPDMARAVYQRHVHDVLALRSLDPSPNDGVPPRG